MNDFTVWVDADGCPASITRIIVKATVKRHLSTKFVADRRIRFDDCPDCEMIVTETGVDSADDYIADRVRAGDIVVTRDIGLSSRVVESGAIVLDDRGIRYTSGNIAERRSVNEFMSEIRSSWAAPLHTSRNQKFTHGAFANAFDRELNARCPQHFSI